MINGKSQCKTCFNLPVHVTCVTEKCELSSGANKECLDFQMNFNARTFQGGSKHPLCSWQE
ncbi:hypothetical protein Celaphus_00016014 [Cervus elaphus hippelaphus]|uniref:Uncharacterized protein n=1 Tax=Cervus elaphus hippelaphus TaxID=46360 RepID=A0A212C232_CEREH|nr:hypothetical protein Celaphus_00016014 [Cervus elaphus hippelaphus]